MNNHNNTPKMMRKRTVNIIKTTVALGLVSLGLTTIAQESKSNVNPQSKTEHDCTKLCKSHDMKTAKIQFKKGKVYELAFADIKPDKMNQLNHDYFPKAMPFIMKYGAKMVGGFSVVENESDMLKSNMVAIFEWPSVDARLNLLKDKEFQKIVHLRDEALNGIQLGYFEVEADKEIEFKSNKIYEFGAANLFQTKSAKKNLDKYFQVSDPIKRSYGGMYPEFILNLSHIDSKNQATYTPHMQFIVEWDSLDDKAKLFANKEFNSKAKPLMMKAVEKADFVYGTFNFPE